MGPVKPADRPDHKVDDPLYLMTLTIPQLILKSLQVIWDVTVFVVFNEDFQLYIKHEDLHLPETSMQVENFNVYGFLEPQSIQRSRQSQFESESYMKNCMQN
ncbi:hypothetical protein GmHk_12G034877 [Glycine max]|nr:hypothetical protein GmHk_12G034877 [Glycine max]